MVDSRGPSWPGRQGVGFWAMFPEASMGTYPSFSGFLSKTRQRNMIYDSPLTSSSSFENRGWLASRGQTLRMAHKMAYGLI